jgi:hypothetical protein
VVANGRPERYPGVVGTGVASESWFVEGIRTKSGGEFAVADVVANPALGGALVATYATAIRERGEERGAPIGALGIFFDWQPQADAIVGGVRLSDDERGRTRAMLADSKFRVIAASDRTGVLTEQYPLQTTQGSQGYYTDAKGQVVGYSLTPGYETYAGLGWYGIIEQRPLSGTAR